MHEVLVTRRLVVKAPYEIQAQIHVPWNCVLVHEGKCHLEAQHTQEGFSKSLYNILMRYKFEDVANWLLELDVSYSLEGLAKIDKMVQTKHFLNLIYEFAD